MPLPFEIKGHTNSKISSSSCAEPRLGLDPGRKVNLAWYLFVIHTSMLYPKSSDTVVL